MQKKIDSAHGAPAKAGAETTRREFLATAALVSGPLLVSPKTAFGTEANSRVTIGAIGCGGRGTWIADLFQKHGGYQVVAAADYFQDKVDELRRRRSRCRPTSATRASPATSGSSSRTSTPS